MDYKILFRIPFTLYFLGIEYLETSYGRIRYKIYLSLFRKKFVNDVKGDTYIYHKI